MSISRIYLIFSSTDIFNTQYRAKNIENLNASFEKETLQLKCEI